MSRITRASAALALSMALVVLAVAPALAHEVRTVGSYQLTVGWRDEPAYVDAPNAVQIFVHTASGDTVDDLGNPPSLKVQAIYGKQTSPDLDLEPSFDEDTGLGTKGELDAPITPTAPGDYTFHITGTINGQAVDEKFTSGDQTFAPVVEPTGEEFPTKNPTIGALAAGVAKAQPRVAAAQSDASDAKSSAQTATILAGVALLVAVIAGAIGIVAVTRRRKAVW